MKTGSFEFQIFLLNKKIEKLRIHLKKHKKDFSNKRHFIILINKLKKKKKYVYARMVKWYTR
ncbi:30S ribosomal protein S15 [Candidatus Vidania fulgoroideorum]